MATPKGFYRLMAFWGRADRRGVSVTAKMRRWLVSNGWDELQTGVWSRMTRGEYIDTKRSDVFSACQPPSRILLVTEKQFGAMAGMWIHLAAQRAAAQNEEG